MCEKDSIKYNTMSLNTQNRIRFAGWNLHGMYRKVNNARLCKLYDDDVVDTLMANDMVFFVETHLKKKDAENVCFPGFMHKFVIRPRSPRAKRNFGGISVFYKDYLSNGITVMPIVSTEYLWLKLDKRFLKIKP